MSAAVDIVIPTMGRPSLALLLAALDGPPDRLPGHLIVVDDRRATRDALPVGAPSPALRARLDVVDAGGRGPAAARNLGWRAARAEWIAFLDDDVIPCRGWVAELARDLDALAPHVAGSRGRVHVSLPDGRRPTDRERALAARATTPWAASDIAYRTSVLRRVGGFDERFTRAGREHADLGLRVRRAGLRVVEGRRTVVRPMWRTRAWASVHAEAVQADDALMRALHGAGWREAAEVTASRFHHHAAITAAGCIAAGGAVAGAPLIAAGGLLAWLAGTATFAWRRIAPGPRTLPEIGTVALTSVAIPIAAVRHRLAGEWRIARRQDLGAPVAGTRPTFVPRPPPRREEPPTAPGIAHVTDGTADRRLEAPL